MKSNFLFNRINFFVLLIILFIGLSACSDNFRSKPPPVVPIPEPLVEASNCPAAQLLPDPSKPNISCPAPPNTFDISRFFAADATKADTQNAGPTWDSWAWASFAAMNWPAKQDSGQPSGYQRGVPDTSKSFANANHDDVLVWETFKEKRELFNKGSGIAIPSVVPTEYPSSVNQNSNWQDFTYAKPQQVGESTGVPVCADASSTAHPTQRIFAQRAKAAHYTDSRDFTETDETIEVASQPCEAATQLCEGLPSSSTGNLPRKSDCISNIFPGTVTGVCEGDKVNQRTPVGPRVWKGDPGAEGSDARPIYFEVKVNYDFWQYILDNKYYLDKNASAAATSPDRSEHPKLPFRTSSGQGPGRSTNAVFDYNAGKTSEDYVELADPNVLPGIGSVQLKAGWLVLTNAEIESNTYHTTKGYFFKTETVQGSGDETQTCAEPATFGLLGLHIIQRVHALDPQNRNADFAYGGTFIFATWEHVGLGEYQQPTDYYYANYLAFPNNFYLQGGPTPVGTPAPFPFNTNDVPFPYWKAAGTSAIPVVRQQPYPLASTEAVNTAAHSAISQANPNSVWLNYRLIGTQFFAADLANPDIGGRQPSEVEFNQPYYLANLVVETNTDLQNFHGLPPGVATTPYYTDKVGDLPTDSAPTTTFQREDNNLVFNRQNIGARNMGGCMGCHGVAQLSGYNFSFVFKGGQEGSGLDTQEEFAVAGGGE